MITELFGFGSGVISYRKAKLIDYELAKSLLIFSIPAAIVGSLGVDYFHGDILKVIFALVLLFIGWQLVSSYRKEEKHKADENLEGPISKIHEIELTDATGQVYNYTICNKMLGRFFALIGGFFVGMISVGLAELEQYRLVVRCKVPTPIAVATSIFTVVITVFFASLGHISLCNCR